MPLIKKLKEIIYSVTEANIPTTNLKNRNSGLPQNIVNKIKEKKEIKT